MKTVYPVTFVVFSQEGQVAFRTERDLPFMPRDGMFMLLTEKDNDSTTVMIEKTYWLEHRPERFVLKCGVEFPGAAGDDGARLYIPYGQLPHSLAEDKFNEIWIRIEDGDTYFTAPQSSL